MIEQLHQLDQCKLWVFSIHCVNLSPKGLAEWMATKILYFQSVFLLNFFQDYVYPLNCKNCAFLTYQYRCFNSDRFYLFVTLLYMFLQLMIQTECSFNSCLFLYYGKFLGIENLIPPQSENVRYYESCKTTKCYK